MAKLKVVGGLATIEILSPGEHGGDSETYLARCEDHPLFWAKVSGLGTCKWAEEYDTLDDAVEYAADHADGGTM